MLNGSPDVVRFAKGQFTCMGLQPLKQFVGGHDVQGHDAAVVSTLDVLGVMQRLTCEVFGQQGISFKDDFFWCSLSQHGDAKGMGEIVFGMKGVLHLEFRGFMRFDVDDSVATERTDVCFAWVPAQQIPTVSVLLQQVWMQSIDVLDVTFFTEFPVGECDFITCTNGLEKWPQMRRSGGVWRAFELDDVVVAVGVQIG